MYVFTGGLGLEGLFLVNGNAEQVEWLRQRYDSGEEVNLEKEADLASAVSLLRLFLQELPEPIIPADLQTHILQLYQGESVFSVSLQNVRLLWNIAMLSVGFVCLFRFAFQRSMCFKNAVVVFVILSHIWLQVQK